MSNAQRDMFREDALVGRSHWDNPSMRMHWTLTPGIWVLPLYAYSNAPTTTQCTARPASSPFDPPVASAHSIAFLDEPILRYTIDEEQ